MFAQRMGQSRVITEYASAQQGWGSKCFGGGQIFRTWIVEECETCSRLVIQVQCRLRLCGSGSAELVKLNSPVDRNSLLEARRQY